MVGLKTTWRKNMNEHEIVIGKFRPEEVAFESALDDVIDEFAGRLTCAQLLGVMFSVYLSRVGVFDNE